MLPGDSDIRVWGNFIINGVRFDGPQYHFMSCSIYRDAKDNLPGSGGYACDCTYQEIANERMGRGLADASD